MECIAQLSRQDFCKSMTVYANPRLWQDVYRPTYKDAPLYVKVQIDPIEEIVTIVSFKAR